MKTNQPRIGTWGGKKVLDAAVGVSLVDDPEANQYPMPLTATGKYDVEVSMHAGAVDVRDAMRRSLGFRV